MREITTAFSVDPKPSTTRHPKRSRERSDVAVAGLVAERQPQRVVGVVGPGGRGQDVGERLADVVHVRRAVAAYVGEEAARREPLRQRDATAAAPAPVPSRHHGVGVEQRHRRVEHVIGAEPEPLDQVGAGEGDLLVGDPHRLRVAARAGGEDQHEQRAGLGGSLRCEVRGRIDALLPRRVVAPLEAYAGQVDALEQRQQPRVGDDHLAVGLADVGEQRLPATRGVQPDGHVAAETGGAELEGHLRGVVHQQPDVRWPIVGEELGEHVRATSTLPDVLPPRPALGTREQGGTVVGRARQQRVPDRASSQEGSPAISPPMRRAWSVVPPRANSSRLAAVK